jgi:hypothetical protein
MDEDVQITRRRAIWPSLTAARHANARAFIDARRNIDGDGLAFIRPPFPAASAAWRLNYFAATVTGRTCALDHEKALLRPHFAMASTQVAATFAGPRRRATAATGPARRCNVDGDFRFLAVEGLIERDFEIIA